MGHLASYLILKDKSDTKRHIGSIFNFMQPICGKFTEDQMDILSWIAHPYQSISSDGICPECFDFYQQGKAYKK